MEVKKYETASFRRMEQQFTPQTKLQKCCKNSSVVGNTFLGGLKNLQICCLLLTFTLGDFQNHTHTKVVLSQCKIQNTKNCILNITQATLHHAALNIQKK
jgi:hypothetical protein